MQLKALLETFVASVAGDSALDTWANENFGKSVSVWKDLPSDTFPNVSDDYPFAVILPIEKTSGQNQRTIEYVLAAWVCISESAYETRAEDDAKEPSGVGLICDFIELVKDAIVTALPANTYLTVSEMIDTLGSPPEVSGYMELNFYETVTIGTNPLD